MSFQIMPSIQEIGIEIDSATAASDTERLRVAAQVCDEMLPSFDGADHTLLHYFRANAFGAIVRIQSKEDLEYAWGWDQPERTQEIFSLRSAIQSRGFAEIDIVRKCQIRTNLGNCLSALGRFVEAIEQWNLVLAAMPHFAMSQGNMGRGLVTYSRYLYDESHRLMLLSVALDHLDMSLSDNAYWDSGPDPLAENVFRQLHGEVRKFLDHISYKPPQNIDQWSLGRSAAERRYRRWCLDERLFLNPLNDVLTATAVAHDVLHLPDHSYKIDEYARFPGYFNLLKQEYVSARYQLFDAIHGREKHFSDGEILLFETFDAAMYGRRVEQLKSSFRGAYSLFDKISIFIKDYFGVNDISVERVNFRNVWETKENNIGVLRESFRESQNQPLKGLQFLSKDIYDKEFTELSEPDAADLSEIRNKLEHRFLTVQEFPSRDFATDIHDCITFDDLQAKTLRMLKMARAALIYLSLAMREEESAREGRDDDRKLSLPIFGIPRK